MQTMEDYHDLYLQAYNFLLADVFDNFRDLCMALYGLDPCYYVTWICLGYMSKDDGN